MFTAWRADRFANARGPQSGREEMFIG